ncbi:MAG: twin-arginine translocase TatA/TatE family subunit [Candidatus Nitrospinota bacterium M3_3B_026]
MFGIGMPEMLVILAVALIAIGPSRMPEIARSLGRAYAELSRSMRDARRSFDDLTSDFEEEREMIRNPRGVLDSAVGKMFPEEETQENGGKKNAGDEAPPP